MAAGTKAPAPTPDQATPDDEPKDAPDTAAADTEGSNEVDAPDDAEGQPEAARPASVADLPRLPTPAPGALPAPGAEVLRDPDSRVEAWVGDGEGGQVGYLRETADPERAVAIADTTAWQQIVDGLGMTASPDGAPNEEDAEEDAPESEEEPPADEEDDDASPSAAAETKAATRTKDDDRDSDEAVQHTGIMVALMIPPGEAADMVIDHPDAEPAEDLHLTLAYLGTTETVTDQAAMVTKILEVMTDIADEYPPINGEVNGLGRFHTTDGDALVLLYDSPTLSTFRQDLVDALADEGIHVASEHGFCPHITLAYLTEGEEWPMNGIKPSVLEFSEMTLAFGDSRISTPLRDDQIPDDLTWMDADRGTMADSTAPSVTGEKAAAKDGANFAPKKGGPPISSGAYVSWSGGKGKVDMVVTNGTVPGVDGDVKGTSSSPAARVVVYKQVDGSWKATGQKIGIATSKLKRTAPLRSASSKSAAEELVVLLAEHNTAIDSGHLPEHARVAPNAVSAVFERGVKSYPGDHTGLTAEEWGVRRTAAFLRLATGTPIPGYRADRDLLAESHPLRNAIALAPVGANDPGPAAPAGEPAAESKAAVTLDGLPSPSDFLAEIAAVLDADAGEKRGLGRFKEDLHPRDADGKFIRKGGTVNLPGGGTGTVVSARGSAVEVEKADGTHVTVKPKEVSAATGKPGGDGPKPDAKPTPDDGDKGDGEPSRAAAPAEPAAAKPSGSDGSQAGTSHPPLTDDEYTAHIAQVEQIIGAEIKAGRTTDAQHTLDANNTIWSPERAAQHKEIIDSLWAKAGGVPRDGKAVIAGGLGGAGKSTVLRDHAGIDPDDYLTVNPDDVKEVMAERGMIPDVEGLTAMEASALVHEESSYLANLLAARAYAERVNIVWDITMSRRASVEKRIAELRTNGYDNVSAVFVDIPVETSVERALKRHRRGLERARAGSGNGGRYVPPALIRANADAEYSSANRRVAEELRGQFDSWQIWDNSVTGRAPERVSVSTPGQASEVDQAIGNLDQTVSENTRPGLSEREASIATGISEVTSGIVGQIDAAERAAGAETETALFDKIDEAQTRLADATRAAEEARNAGDADALAAARTDIGKARTEIWDLQDRLAKTQRRMRGQRS